MYCKCNLYEHPQSIYKIYLFIYAENVVNVRTDHRKDNFTSKRCNNNKHIVPITIIIQIGINQKFKKNVFVPKELRIASSTYVHVYTREC